MSLKASLSSLPTGAISPLAEDEEQELCSLLDGLLDDLSQVEMRLVAGMTRYRQLVGPLVGEAVSRVASPRRVVVDVPLRRLFYVDSYEAQACMGACVRHIGLMAATVRCLHSALGKQEGGSHD